MCCSADDSRKDLVAVKRMKLRSLSFAALASVVIGGIGCASRSTDIMTDRQISVKLVSSRRAEISRIEAVDNGGMFQISGMTRQYQHFGTLVRGHVDLSIINPDGEKLLTCSVPQFPESFPRGTGMPARFSVELPLIPDPGSTVLAVYHEEPMPRGSDSCAAKLRDKSLGSH